MFEEDSNTLCIINPSSRIRIIIPVEDFKIQLVGQLYFCVEIACYLVCSCGIAPSQRHIKVSVNNNFIIQDLCRLGYLNLLSINIFIAGTGPLNDSNVKILTDLGKPVAQLA